MADELYQPHDKLFRAVFSDAPEAASLLQTALPPEVRDRLDWTTLTLQDGTFLDEDLRESQSDLLYQVELAETQEPVALYLLFEHQSSPDRWMRFRLLKYCCRIWDASLRQAPDQTGLRPIVPVVFYQGPRGWSYSTELADLFPEAVRSWPWQPRFAHVLLDQTTLEPEEVAGEVNARIAQLLMMVAFNRHVEAALELAAALVRRLLASGGVGQVRRYNLYLMATVEPERIETYKQALRRHGMDQGDAIMTYAQQLLDEGRAEGRAEGETKGRAEGRAEGETKGRAEGQVEVVEGFLAVGVPWETIEAATGLNESTFRALKQQVAASGS